jgi:hypothetical protein
MKIIQGVPQNRITEVLDYSHQFFEHVMGEYEFKHYIKFSADVNWGESILLIDSENKIMGVYLLGRHQINTMITAKDYIGLKGVEGVLLCVDETLRGQGYGNQLKDYTRTLGYDYIWGQQFKELGNLDDWLKRRELVGETEYVYITAEKFN